jgi:hypothetical protein
MSELDESLSNTLASQVLAEEAFRTVTRHHRWRCGQQGKR